MLIGRRNFLLGLTASALAAPAIIRVIDLMPIKPASMPPIMITYDVLMDEMIRHFADDYIQQLNQLILYGDPNAKHPFTGLALHAPR